jgi:hypothetical protein
VHPAASGPLANRSHLKDDVSEKTSDAERDVVEEKLFGAAAISWTRRATCAAKRSDKAEKQQPESEGGH